MNKRFDISYFVQGKLYDVTELMVDQGFAIKIPAPKSSGDLQHYSLHRLPDFDGFVLDKAFGALPVTGAIRKITIAQLMPEISAHRITQISIDMYDAKHANVDVLLSFDTNPIKGQPRPWLGGLSLMYRQLTPTELLTSLTLE